MRPGQLLVVAVGLLGVTATTVAVAPAVRAADPVVVLSSDFENGTAQGWFGRGSAALTVSTDAAHGGTASLLSTGRTATWNGPGRNVLGLVVPGATYAIRAQVQLAAGSADAPMHLTMQRTPTGGSTGTATCSTSSAGTETCSAR